MSKKQRPPLIVTPVGLAAYPRLSKPDDKFDKENPKYSITLRLLKTDPETIKLMERLDELADAGFEEAKSEHPKIQKQMKRHDPYVDETDDEGEDTGYILVRAKMNSKWTDNATGKVVDMTPDVRDAKNKKVDRSTLRMGGGSKIKIAFRASPMFNASNKLAGITNRLVAVQILELVEYNGNDSIFDEEEGYEADHEEGGAFGGDECDTSGDQGGEDSAPAGDSDF